ncbi:hypothetical protein [Salinirussus salinus]|jgi:hypothetical protein|uniref:hypothetical protein n=1 Tax=Salinirussus salinus TaxID=1198300 RepID=UPI00135C28D5|nr:hypothetical protein [Salinirussus salinus]
MVPDSEDSGSESDLLGRGWTPSRRTRALVFVGVGLLLVVHAAVGGLPAALGLTGTVEYHALSVEADPDGDRLLFSGGVDGRPGTSDLAVRGGLRDVDCYLDVAVRGSAACALERPLVEADLTLPDDDAPEDWRGYTYHGRFYERVSERTNGTVTLGLRPVPAGDVLADAAVPVESVPEVSGGDAVRRAVETGSVRVDPPFAYAREVLRSDGGYYVLVAEDFPSEDDGQHPVTTTLSAALGVLLLQRGRRRYGQWRAENGGAG